MPARSRAIPVLLALAVLLVACVAIRLMAGGTGSDGAMTRELLWIRASRVGSCVTVGAALGVAGVLLQSLLRNPLASPDLLGLASGAGLGIMITVYVGYLSGLGIAHAQAGSLGASGAALVGACATLALVYIFSQKRGLLDPITLVLVGVVVSIMCAGVIVLLKHLMPDQGVAADRLLLGAIRDDVRGSRIVIIGAVCAAAIAAGAIAGPAMDAGALGDDEARSVGVALGGLRALLFVLSGVLTACAVVLAGPIGFVGLICPHAVRLLAGPSHRTLVIGSAMAGAVLTLGADALVRVIDLNTGRIPIGVVTSLVGGPVLIVLLKREMSGRGA